MLLPVVRRWLAAALALGFCTGANADDVLFENVRIFDGKSDALSASTNVLVRGNIIAEISKDLMSTDVGDDVPGR